MISVSRKIKFVRRSNSSRAIAPGPAAPVAVPASRVPRISRLMALAIHFDRLLREGKVRDRSELARLAHVTQPRMTQIMNLNHLAPDIQEKLLFLRHVSNGREPMHERMLRKVAGVTDWGLQQRLWLRCLRARSNELR